MILLQPDLRGTMHARDPDLGHDTLFQPEQPKNVKQRAETRKGTSHVRDVSKV